MASLTHVAYTSRRLIKFGSIGLVSFAIMWSLTVAGLKAYTAAHPPYVAPTVKYGIIPKIVFADKKFEVKNFTKELPNDEYPVFKDQAPVYVVYRSNNNILALEEDKATAAKLGFTDLPREISINIYEFKNNKNQTLTMNTTDGSFKMIYPYQQDQILLNPEKVPTKNEAIEIASGYLRSASKLPDDLERGEQVVTYWKISETGFKSVESLAEANAARVDFFRKNVDNDFKIVTSEPGRASVSVLVSGSQVDGKRVIEVNYKYSPVDRESFSTYPIKPVEKAWEDLTAGNYWAATDIAMKDVTIRKITLAYFEPVSLTNYMQPVYKFEGDGKFVAYVRAVDEKFVK